MDELSFENLNLSPEMMRAIVDAGYTEMTPIQQKVIPVIRSGRDCIGQSSTGTGKTAAFGIPMIEMLEETEDPDPQGLVICPTRELAMQVSDEIRKFSKYKEGVRVCTVYGGQSIDTQIRALKRCSIVVGTPGRILDHLRRRTLKLKNIRLAVLDEADEMLDMGFLDDIKQILFNTPEDRRTALFSATMPAPILRLTQRFLKNPEHIKGDDGDTAFHLIDQYYVEVPRGKKAQAIRLLLQQRNAQRALIFCNTKRMVDILTKELEAMGLAAQCLHGDMTQGARTAVMAAFKAGECNLLIATDVAARGIDASGVDIIINFDIPQDMEYYVHRIGRTGRAGNTGAAFTIIAGHGELFSLCDIEDTTGIQLKPFFLEGIENAPDDTFRTRGMRDSGGDRRGSFDRGRSGGGDRRPGGGDRRPSPSGSRPSGGGSRSAPLRRPTGDNAVIAFDVGSEHDVDDRQIASAIIKYARLKRDEIGKITVGAQESTVELAPEAARQVMRDMQEATVNDFVVVLRAVSGVKAIDESGNARDGRPQGRARAPHRGPRRK